MRQIFGSKKLDILINQRCNMLKHAVEESDDDVILGTPTQDLVCSLYEQYSLMNIILEEPQQKIDDVQIDVAGNRRDLNEYTAGKRCTLTIPYKGEQEMFDVCPSKYTQNRPRGIVGADDITLEIEVPGSSGEVMKREVMSVFHNFRQYVEWINSDILVANDAIREWAAKVVDEHIRRILVNRNMEAFLPFRVEQRKGAPSYGIPLARKKMRSPLTSAESFQPQPAVARSDYHHILMVLQGMGIMLERAWNSFVNMHEEDLRHIFLAALNTHFVEQASGETFNSEGKTDILIKHENGGIVFVAECKVWTGPMSLCDAIDQVLSYLTWRESKAAIILFNRDRQIATVLNAVPKTVAEHPQWKRTEQSLLDLPSTFLYTIKHPSDENIEVSVSILVFNLPFRK